MNGPKAILSLSLICALVLSALAAPNALAAKGTTASTCVKGGGAKDFTDAHCTKAGKGEFGHVEIAPGTSTKFIATNEKTATETTGSTAAVFRFDMKGVVWEFVCGKMSIEGSLTNEAGSPMKVTGTSISIALTGCKTAGAALENEGCALEGEAIKTPAPLTATTPTEGMVVEFKPGPEKITFTFKLTKCKTAGLNIEYAIHEPFSAIPEGATLTTTAATTGGLIMPGTSGENSFTSKTTVRMAPVEGKEQNPIALTTTES